MAQTGPRRKSIDTDHLTWIARALDIYVLHERVNPEELIGKIASLEYLAYPSGSEIVTEGADGKDMYLLFRGSAEVLRAGRAIARLEPGDLFGEIGFLIGVPRTATVRAGANCEVFRCESAGFEELLARHPNLLDSMRTIARMRMEKLKAS